MAMADDLKAAFANLYHDGLSIGALANLKLKIDPKGIVLKAGQTGEIEWDEIDSGMVVSLSLEIQDITFANFARAYPGSSIEGDTLVVQANVGSGRRAAAAPLIIKPIVGGVETTDNQFWTTVPLAAIGAGNASEIGYNDGQQQRIMANYKVFPTLRSSGAFMFAYMGPAPA